MGLKTFSSYTRRLFSMNNLKGDYMTRYLLMSINLGIWNIKHAFIEVTTDSVAFIRT